MGKPIDLGLGHSLIYVQWGPDRRLNPQYKGIPNVKRYGADIIHPFPEGAGCNGHGMVTFDGPVQRQFSDSPRWEVVQEEPLTLSPSILCKLCGDHGYVREGKWVPA